MTAVSGTPYVLSRAEGELIELVNGAAESSFILTLGRDPEGGWLLRLFDGETATEREVSGSTFADAWTALRRGPRGFATIKGGRA